MLYSESHGPNMINHISTAERESINEGLGDIWYVLGIL